MVIWLCEEPGWTPGQGVARYGVWTDGVRSIPVVDGSDDDGYRGWVIFLRSGGNGKTVANRAALGERVQLMAARGIYHSPHAHALVTESIDGYIQAHPDLDYVYMEPDELLALLPELPRIEERIEQ